MARTPFDAHLCAADPLGWAAGFDQAADWIIRNGPVASARVYQAVRDSTGVPWPVTAGRLGWSATAEREGLALGVYGLVRLLRHDDGTRPPGHASREVELAGPEWGRPAPERLAAEAEAEAGHWTCEPYSNGKGWWHERGCPHVNWGGEYPA